MRTYKNNAVKQSVCDVCLNDLLFRSSKLMNIVHEMSGHSLFIADELISNYDDHRVSQSSVAI